MRARVVAAATVLLLASSLGCGTPFLTNVDGRPASFEKGEIACYAVWHTPGKGWHVAATTAGHRHHFKGVITIEGDGHFGPVVPWKGAGELATEVVRGDWFPTAVAHEPKKLYFDFVSEGRQVSAINFTVEGTGPLRWDLWIGAAHEGGGAVRAPGHVLVGRAGEHPPSLPFDTYAHPDVEGHGH